MISKKTVENIVLPFISETAIFMVDLKVDSASKISVEVDKPEGITIEECVTISRAIEAGLNRETEDFELEVSSPGLTEPFKVMEQYHKNCGSQVDVIKRDGQKLSGVLQKVEEEGIVLEIKSKVKDATQRRAKTVMQTIAIQFSEIKTTKCKI